MRRSANKTLIGAFVAGGIVLCCVAVVLLGGGAFSFSVPGGGADDAPAAWAEAPAACGF